MWSTSVKGICTRPIKPYEMGGESAYSRWLDQIIWHVPSSFVGHIKHYKESYMGILPGCPCSRRCYFLQDHQVTPYIKSHATTKLVLASPACLG